MKEINVIDIKENYAKLVKDDWALLTSGDIDNFNTMTVSWVTMGYLWNRHVVEAYVRPTRHTYQYMEENDIFTLTFLKDGFKEDLSYLGRVSGRDEDKVSQTKLNPLSIDGTTSFKEAKLVFVLKKIATYEIDPAKFIDPTIDKHYNCDYHKVYAAEVLKVYEM